MASNLGHMVLSSLHNRYPLRPAERPLTSIDSDRSHRSIDDRPRKTNESPLQRTLKGPINALGNPSQNWAGKGLIKSGEPPSPLRKQSAGRVDLYQRSCQSWFPLHRVGDCRGSYQSELLSDRAGPCAGSFQSGPLPRKLSEQTLSM